MVFDSYRHLLFQHKPPWTKFLSFNLVVLSVLVASISFLWKECTSLMRYIHFQWSYGKFKDTQEHTQDTELYFFDAIDKPLDSDGGKTIFDGASAICLPCEYSKKIKSFPNSSADELYFFDAFEAFPDSDGGKTTLDGASAICLPCKDNPVIKNFPNSSAFPNSVGGNTTLDGASAIC